MESNLFVDFLGEQTLCDGYREINLAFKFHDMILNITLKFHPCQIINWTYEESKKYFILNGFEEENCYVQQNACYEKLLPSSAQTG